MAIHKLSLDDFQDDDFSLISIYTTLDDYLLAFKLNEVCGLRLIRAKEDLEYSEHEVHSFFDFEDKRNDAYFALLKNKSEVSNQENSDALFNVNKVVYILPEYNKADYLLKIEPKNDILGKELLTQINRIDRVSTSRLINNKNIKNLSNLIF